MRVLVVSDLHGNLAALNAVSRELYDAVICLGDIVGYGPEPHACVFWVQEHAAWAIQGNHDLAFGANISARCTPRFAWLAHALTPYTFAQLRREELNFLRDLPQFMVRTIDGVRIACVHATPSDRLYGYLPPTPEAWAKELDQIEADLVLVGHSHVQFDLAIGARRLINPGSVGQPQDGDPRAAYAILVDGRVELRRAAYPIEKTTNALEATGVDARATLVLGEMLRTGKPPQS